MRLVPIAVLVLALTANAADPVLLASRRGGWMEAFSLDTLETVSRIRVPAMAESVAADPAGQRVFVAAPRAAGKSCCALFALNLQSMRLSALAEPALSATTTEARLFTQRGNVGIEAFDLHSLTRLPTIQAPGVYRLRPSPDGRLLAGLTNWPHPSLDLFDTAQGRLMASHSTPEGASTSGAWLGQQYFLFTVQSGQATLRTFSPDSGQVADAIALSNGTLSNCRMTPYDVVSLGTRLAIYGQFGLKSDGSCAVPGGYVVVDPKSGAVTERLASEMRFRQMVASADGRYLFGLDVGSPAWSRVRIVKMDAASGQVIGEKVLAPDVWYLTTGQIPHQLAGRLDLVAIPPPGL